MKTKPPKLTDHTTETMPADVARAIGKHATITAVTNEKLESIINIFIDDRHFEINTDSPVSMIRRMKDIWDYLGK